MDHHLEVQGHVIDLERLYQAMAAQAAEEHGRLIYKGNSKHVTAIKHLLHELFGIPVADTIDPVNAEARRAVTLELHRLGWATKVNARNEPVLEGQESRSGRYLLHRSP